MSRRHVTFACGGATLVGTLDDATGDTGLLIVSGGNEVRSGAFSGQAQLARRIAKEGHPVFRFDRRGIGDSEGVNGGFTSSASDIAAALAAFRKSCPGMARIVAFGNCDAASALMLTGGSDADALALSNPWTFEEDSAQDTPPAAVRGHYAQRLRDPAAIMRLLSGKVSLRGLFSSLAGALRPAPPQTGLVQDMTSGIANYPGPVRFLIADRDRTALAFLGSWRKGDKRIHRCTGATHAYVEADAHEWLVGQLLEMLGGT